jgi:hypothetical protein
MRIPRMTIRRWMITVALAAAVITAGQLVRLSRRFHKLAEWHQAQARTFAATAAIFKPPIVEKAFAAEVDEVLRQFEEGVPLWRLIDFSTHPIPVTAQEARREEKQRAKAAALFSAMNSATYLQSQHLADYHGEMSRKYRRATGQPWLPVPPDPPVPTR